MYQNWDELKQACLNCRECGLCADRTQVVFGVGNPEAEVLFIGEGPGEQEDLLGEPFVGRSGRLLDQFLAAIDLNRKQNIYIANIVKCRPPKNRDPLPQEQTHCEKWLTAQMEMIRPKIVVCLGRIAIGKLIDPAIKVTQEHGQFIQKENALYMPTFHPAALLRNPNNKVPAFEDFLALRAKIESICEYTY